MNRWITALLARQLKMPSAGVNRRGHEEGRKKDGGAVEEV